MNKNTPKPWRCLPIGSTNRQGIYDADGNLLFTGERGGLATETRRIADAMLTAAAPDLLAALEKLYRLHCGLDSWHEDAMADAWGNACTAIAKAKGEA